MRADPTYTEVLWGYGDLEKVYMWIKKKKVLVKEEISRHEVSNRCEVGNTIVPVDCTFGHQWG